MSAERDSKPDDYRELAKVCRAWWRGLQALDKDGNAISTEDWAAAPNRKALAELRRIKSDLGETELNILDALAVSQFGRLVNLGRAASLSDYLRSWLRIKTENAPHEAYFEPFLVAAATLAHIKSDSGEKLEKRGEKWVPGATARLLGKSRATSDEAAADQPRENETEAKKNPRFAEARFKRLIRTRDDWPGLMRQARRIAAILEREAPVGDLGASLILWNADPRISRDWAFQYYQREFVAADTSKDAGNPEAPENNPA